MSPSGFPSKLNHLIDDLDDVLEVLKAAGQGRSKREEHEYGKFARLVDPEGNNIEVWQSLGALDQASRAALLR